MSTRKGRRPWVAVLLAFVYPGLGHVYLREWLRALLWFGLAVGSVVLLVPEPAGDPGSGFDLLRFVGGGLPLGALLALLSVTAFSMLDAYRIATRRSAPDDDAAPVATCPSCGRELDEDLEFCHWCTEELDSRQ